MRSTGLVLAAGGIAAANEVIFAPLAAHSSGQLNVTQTFNWRILPATFILAFMLAGFEEIAPDFAVALGGLTILAVLIIPVGKAPTPLENVASVITGKSN